MCLDSCVLSFNAMAIVVWLSGLPESSGQPNGTNVSYKMSSIYRKKHLINLMLIVSALESKITRLAKFYSEKGIEKQKKSDTTEMGTFC